MNKMLEALKILILCLCTCFIFSSCSQGEVSVVSDVEKENYADSDESQSEKDEISEPDEVYIPEIEEFEIPEIEVETPEIPQIDIQDLLDLDISNLNEPNNKEYIPGKRTETSFESEWAGFKYELPEGYVMLSDEEINSMMGIATDAMNSNPEEYEAILKERSVVYEFSATNLATNANVIVASEKYPYSVEAYAASVKAQLKNLENDSVEYVVDDDLFLFQVNGIDFYRINLSSKVYGITIKQSYLLKKIDDRMINFVFTSSSAEDIENCINCIKVY